MATPSSRTSTRPPSRSLTSALPTATRRRPVRLRSGRGTASGGFTLLEVLVAVAILSMSLTSLLQSQLAGLKATDQARMLSSVAFLAEYQLVEIEWQLKVEGGWGTNDRTFEGDFADQGWPSVSYTCTVDLIEMPDYSALQQAADAATGGAGGGGGVGGYNVKDAGETAFDTLALVWPIVKEAIENSIRKSWCTVRWTKDGSLRKTQQDGPLCADDDYNCMTVATFWSDPAALTQLPTLGGEVDESDDTRDGPSDGGSSPSSGSRPGGGAGGERGGMGSPTTRPGGRGK